MQSIKNVESLPNAHTLKAICKAISVLDAILSPEWEFRYYSYNSHWDDNEECMHMRNGQGDEMHVLFTSEGVVINGFAHQCIQPPKDELTTGLPPAFSEFIFGEPVQSIGTTFLLWKTGPEPWYKATNEHCDNSAEMLQILDGKPQIYLEWATEYFEGSYTEKGLPLSTVTQIYNGATLTNEMVLSISNSIENWQQLIADMDEIGYPHTLSNPGKKSSWQFWK
ncbi:hypothetical protein AM493_13500 [Flavobacterium akiainvivens]|uniref:Uncharacterized protein n=1 Tax=Flavobacterium akiainvivens TaxID=1202724 RepID=A0A0M9VJ01_9FLAO|nr:hypothetical protein [Flavobacterium akiainvivens]KOS06932.1 hypothetical protein AM493_13500 [Flavobacterium akiainvivens]SFQ69950.1 hypothetical protein SAMN05444144_11592 [Flavobacterium akiainvivens]